MYCFVGIEALAVNALYELYLSRKTTSVSFKTLRDYGLEVVKQLNEETNTRAVLIMTRQKTQSFLTEYSDLFEVDDFDSPNPHLSLKKGVRPEDMLRKFVGSIPVSILKVMRNENALNVVRGKAA